MTGVPFELVTASELVIAFAMGSRMLMAPPELVKASTSLSLFMRTSPSGRVPAAAADFNRKTMGLTPAARQ